ncbi:MAG: hypothetical protein JSS49_22495 [Planctomycetes bacterium]|nr:hypothetical protein [Planctomycetota bacterium]
MTKKQFLICATSILLPIAVAVFLQKSPPCDSRLQGWAGPAAVQDVAAWTAQQPRFKIVGPDGLPVVQDNDRANVRLWALCRLATRLTDGKTFELPPQQTGDCTAFGGSNAVTRTQGAQILAGDRASLQRPFPPFSYGAGRVWVWKPTIVGRLPAAGCSGAAIAQAAKEYGILSWEEAEAAGYTYSGKLADDWGRSGPPAALKAIAARHKVKTVSLLHSVEEVRDAIVNGFGVTEASSWGNPERQFVVQDGRIVAKHTGVWMHQMCIDGYDGSAASGKRYFHVQNSHPPELSPDPIDGSPPGSWWVEWSDMEFMVAPGDCWAYSDFEGFPAQHPDLFSMQGATERPARKDSDSPKTRMSP